MDNPTRITSPQDSDPKEPSPATLEEGPSFLGSTLWRQPVGRIGGYPVYVHWMVLLWLLPLSIPPLRQPLFGFYLLFALVCVIGQITDVFAYRRFGLGSGRLLFNFFGANFTPTGIHASAQEQSAIPLRSRLIVFLAGPAVNLLFAILAFLLAYLFNYDWPLNIFGISNVVYAVFSLLPFATSRYAAQPAFTTFQYTRPLIIVGLACVLLAMVGFRTDLGNAWYPYFPISNLILLFFGLVALVTASLSADRFRESVRKSIAREDARYRPLPDSRLTGSRIRLVRILALLTPVTALSIIFFRSIIYAGAPGNIVYHYSSHSEAPIRFVNPVGYLWRDLQESDTWSADLTWSSGAREIAFLCDYVFTDPDRGVDFTSTQQDICTASIDGRTKRHLISTPDSEEEPLWSPDGRSIIYSTLSEVFKLDLVTNETVPLSISEANRRTLAWSPDSRNFAWIETGEAWSIVHIFDLKGSEIIQLDPGDNTASQPAWSSDGKSLYFISGLPNQWGIYRIGIEGKDISRLTADSQDISSYSISPDGHTIAYQADGSLFSTGVNGGEIQRLTPDWIKVTSDNDAHPVWSPDGRYLVFLGKVWDYEDALFLVTARGRWPMQIVAKADFDPDFLWVP